MSKQTSKLNPQWVREARNAFKEFLTVTGFPHPERNGARGKKFDYPEWMIMFIDVLSAKAKVRNYLAIHRLALQYWDTIATGTEVRKKPISESQLRERLKKISGQPGSAPDFVSQVFPPGYLD